jgi:hypothetical protein
LNYAQRDRKESNGYRLEEMRCGRESMGCLNVSLKKEGASRHI